ncbi:MAG: glycosyltransferase family 39 protein [Lachnospiraceae bacterium]|nr:glycosyltransferase family 39 protein [Lachnospiraceae bacterium]
MNVVLFYNELFTILFMLMAGAVIALDRVKKTAKAEGTAKTVDDVTSGQKKNSREIYVFLGMLFVAFLLRAWKFGAVPGGMNQDGAMAAVDAKALADYATDRFGTFLPTHFTAWGYGQMSVLLSYCMVPFIKLFGLNVITARIPILIASMLGLAALYGIAKKLCGTRAAYVTLAFAVCNPWHFMQSRWALDCNLFPHVLLISIWLLLKGLDGKKRWLYFSMVGFALCMYCYGIAFYTVPLLLFGMAGYLLVKRILKWHEVLICVAVYAFVAWPIYLTMMINAFKWNTIKTFFCTMPYFPESVRSRDILFFSDDKLAQLIKNFQSLKNVYVSGDTLPWNTVPGFGVVTKCFLPFVLVGTYACIRQMRSEENSIKKAGYAAALFFFAIGNLSGLITANVNVNRVNVLHYALLLMAGLGIDFAVSYLNKRALLILLAYGIMSVLFVNAYFTEHAQTLRSNFYAEFLDAVRIAGDEKQTDCRQIVITPDTQYAGSASVSEILTLFALSVDARFFQGETVDQYGQSYHEKFHYVNVLPESMDPSLPVAYVIKTVYLGDQGTELLEENGFVIKKTNGNGKYCVVIPRERYLGN